MKQRIALVDDDKNILTSVAMALEAAGFAVSAYSDGATALQGLLETPADLAVLDVKMPRMDGLELLRKIRERSSMPVIFLTSKADEADQLTGLRHGADDYVTKPFSQKLLLERIRAVLRRQELQQPAPENPPPQVFILGDLTLDETRRTCLWKTVPIDMTATEIRLLKALAEHPGHIKSREQLMNFAYGDALDTDDRTIDSHIKRIRKKFKDIDADFDAIETVYGAGYRYTHD